MKLIGIFRKVIVDIKIPNFQLYHTFYTSAYTKLCKKKRVKKHVILTKPFDYVEHITEIKNSSNFICE